MTPYRCFHVALTLLLIASFHSSAQPLIKNDVLCIPDSPPYSGKSLQYNGPLTELIVNSLKKSNIELTLISPPWARIMHEAKEAKCIIAGLWPTAQRKEHFYFSEKPVIKQTLGLYIRKDRQLTDISNGTLAIQRSTYVSKNISITDWNIYDVSSINQGAQMLALSRVDALYAEVGRMDYLLSKNEDFAKKIKLSQPIIEHVYGYLAISKKHKNAKNILNALDSNIEKVLLDLKSSEVKYLNLSNEFIENHDTH